MPDSTTILVLNSGSSSIKFSLFTASTVGEEPRPLFEGEASGIGGQAGKISIKGADGAKIVDRSSALSDAEAAFKLIADELSKPPFPYPAAIGHRVVSGGPTLTSHQRLTPAMLAEIEEHVEFAPLHIPAAAFIMRQAEKLFPGVPNFACFDTDFHTSIPEVAVRFALPDKYWEQGVRRYGAHGLSYESIVYQLRDDLPSRMIVAHLGSGCSIAAIKEGKSLDTSMGLTPTGGIISGTRTGDLDPGVMIYILRELQESATATKDATDQLESIVAKKSGLLGASQLSNDMRVLREAVKRGDAHATMAVAEFTYSIRKCIGSYIAVLGGLDALVFTGGIGENDAETRLEVCAGLEHLGVVLDSALDAAPGSGKFNAATSKVQIKVLPAEEDLMIAMHTFRLMQES